MRRYLIVAALVLGSLAGMVPQGAKAGHCNRIIVFTGVKGVGGLNAGTVGCNGVVEPANTNRITPGSNYARVRVLQDGEEPIPVGGVFKIGEKVVELDLTPDNEAAPTQFNSQEIPIGSSGNIDVEIQFADGSTEKSAVPR